MNDRFLIVANWKANFVDISKWTLDTPEAIEVVVAPSFPQLALVKNFALCAQDVSAYPIGAYTGEVPAKFLADLGVKYCLVGHSERRKYLHETNLEVEKKMEQAIQNGITPILCAQTREEIPENIRNFPIDSYLIMFEPFSAISTAGQYHPESVETIVVTLTDWKNKLNLQGRFLYGGSVKANDISNYLNPETRNLISGFVVGHASLDVDTFSAIIEKCLQTLPSS